MGALHQGHLELINRSVEENNFTICSIYVNPAQFNDKQDLIKYPRNLENDLDKLKSQGCDAVFCPSDQVMYPDKPLISIDFGYMEQIMEGHYRPGHFQGVALVVSKLFNIVQPDRVYFGEKDWQQLVIVRKLASDLSYPLEVIGVPIQRESNGLAMSSRNQRLTTEQRKVAGEIYKALYMIQTSLKQDKDIQSARGFGITHLQKYPNLKLEYLEVVHAFTLRQPSTEIGIEPLSICLAAFLGDVRLIDNIQVFTKEHTS